MNYDEIKKIIDDMGNSKLDSLEIEFPEGMKISMTKSTGQSKTQEIVTTKVNDDETIVTATKSEEKTAGKIEEEFKSIRSPMVGTFYLAPSPDSENFVTVGEKISKGKVVCIVEAMKLMNEIESEFNGEIVEICVDNGNMVEYGEPLFKLK